MSGSSSAKRITSTNRQSFDTLVAELTNAQTKLHENRIRTEAMINSLGEGLITIDMNGEITTINRYAVESLGYTEEELVGSWFPKMFRAVDQYHQPIDQLARPIIRALTSGQAVSERLYYLKKDGTPMPVFVTVSPILMHDRPIGAVEVFRDLTQEHELDLAKEEFVSLASHQLRTPATGVMTILSMLAAGDFGPLNERQQMYLQKAIRTNDRQLQIIEDLLNAARVDAGKMQLDTQKTDMVCILKEVVADHQAIIKTRNQTIELEAPKYCEVEFDVQKMRMVFDNLISNASKYSHADSCINVNLKIRGDNIVLSVRDHGVGISQTDSTRLFTKFTRIDNELSAAVGGTGLGLFLVKGVVELHQGEIAVSSTPGEGSTFLVRLPITMEKP